MVLAFQRLTLVKYLGVLRQLKPGWKKHEEWVLSKMSRRIWGIRKMMVGHRKWGPMEGMRLWDVMVRPMVWWAVGGWEPSASFLAIVTRKKRALVKEWLGVASTAANVGVEGEVGMWRAEDEVMFFKLLFWGRLKRSNSAIVMELLPGSKLDRWVRDTKRASGLSTNWESKRSGRQL
jgi:hypothetical protein